MIEEKIPQKVLDVINRVLLYVDNTEEDWIRVKKEIIWSLPPSLRKLFSKRHRATEKHSLNEFEKLLIEYWFKATGTYLTIPEHKRHDPSWVRHRRGWGLKRYNKERQKNAETKRRKKTS